MPGMRCSVAGCKNRWKNTISDKSICYHRFPRIKNIRSIWIQCCCPDDKWNPDTARICSIHFTPDDYERDFKAEFSFPKSRKMPVSCAVSVCRNQHVHTKREGKDIRYMNFPRSREMKKIWIERCDRGDNWEPRFSRMCSIHFTDDDYERDLKAELIGTKPRKALKKTAVPSLFLSKDYSKEDKARTEPKKPREYKQIENKLLKLPPLSYGRNVKKNIAVPSSSYAIAVDCVQVEPTDQVEDSTLDVHGKVESILPDVSDVPNLAIVKKEPIDDTEEVFPPTSRNIPAVESSTSFTLPLKLENYGDEMTIPVNPADLVAPATFTSTGESIPLPYTGIDGTEPSSKIGNLSHLSNRVLFVVPENSSTSNSTESSSKRPNLSHGSKHLVLIVPENSSNSYACTDSTGSSDRRTTLSHVSNRSVFDVPEITTTLHTVLDGTEPPSKRPKLSWSPSTRSAEIKDEFSVFGDFVAAKIRSFTDRCLQVEAQHRITDMLFEMEMKDLKNNLPSISGISSLQPSSSPTVMLPSSPAIGMTSSLQTQMSATVTPSSSAISKISSFQAQVPRTVALSSSSSIARSSNLQTLLPEPSSSAIRISSFQTIFPPTVTLPSSSAMNKITSLQTPLPETMTLPSSSAVRISSLRTIFPPAVTLPSSSSMSKISSMQTPFPMTVTLPFSSAISGDSNFQTQLPATVMLPPSSNLSLQKPLPVTETLPSTSAINRNSSLETPLPVTVTLPSTSAINRNSSLQKPLPVTVTLPSTSAINRNSSLQTQLPATFLLYSNSAIGRMPSLQTQMPASVTLPSSSVIPIIIPSTSANTAVCNTQSRPGGSKRA